MIEYLYDFTTYISSFIYGNETTESHLYNQEKTKKIEKAKKKLKIKDELRCHICLEDEGKSYCGSCSGLICASCYRSTYLINKGILIMPKHFICCFCQESEKFDIPYQNKIIKQEINDKYNNVKGYYYECGQCLELNYFGGIQCNSNIDPYQVKNQICQDCNHLLIDDEISILHKYKPCPNCNVMTYKDGGCDVVYCQNCKYYWCFICGKFKALGADIVETHIDFYMDLSSCID